MNVTMTRSDVSRVLQCFKPWDGGSQPGRGRGEGKGSSHGLMALLTDLWRRKLKLKKKYHRKDISIYSFWSNYVYMSTKMTGVVGQG